MALQLGKNLAQVLSGGSTISNNNNEDSTISATSDFATAGTASTISVPSNEVFNVSKAKKIDLQSLSSRLVSTSSLQDPGTSSAGK